jgi:succinoglycan biosynthesis transport protein ExoP
MLDSGAQASGAPIARSRQLAIGKEGGAAPSLIYARAGRRQELDWDASQTETLSRALHFCLAFVQRHWLVMVGGLLLGLVLAPVALKLAPPRYVATTTILFDQGKLQLFSPPTMLETSDGLDDQIEIIQSDLIARKVLEDLGPVAEQEFKVPEKGRVERVLGSTIASFLGLAKERTEVWRQQYRLSRFQDAVQARRVSGTRVISISFHSDSAERAAQIANLIANAYFETQVNDKRLLTRRTIGWMSERLEELKRQAAEAQAAVNKFRAVNSLMEGAGYQAGEARASQLTAQVATEKFRLSELTARLATVESVVREYAAAETKPALSELMNNSLVTKLREQLYELKNRRALWLERYKPGHQALAQLDRRIGELHAALKHEHERLAEAYRSDIEIAKSKVALLTKELDEVLAQQQSAHKARITLRELESKAQASQALYDGLLKRHYEAAEQETFPIARGRVLNDAVIPLGKEYKKTLKLAIVLLLMGIGLGCGAAVLRELGDRTFRTLHEIDTLLGGPLLAVLPCWPRGWTLRSLMRASSPAASMPRGGILRLRESAWANGDVLLSQSSEALRTLKNMIDQRAAKHGCKVIGVTSAHPGEGSSTLAAALAATMAVSGRRALLVDCDLRNPTLSRLIAPGATTGLVDIISRQVPFSDAVVTEPSTGFSFLPAPRPAGTRSDQLLADEALDRLVASARESFDYVIVDLPSLVPLADVMVAKRYIDGYISVVAWGISDKESTRRAFEHAPNFRDYLIGIVLNKVNMRQLRAYDPAAAQWFDVRRYRNYLNLSPAST